MANIASPFSYKQLTTVVCMAVLLLATNNHYCPAAAAPITCNDVYTTLYPCVGYLVAGGTVPTGCCDGMKTLNSTASTTNDRQVVCRCLQTAAAGVTFTSYSLRLAAGLPARCGLSMPYQLNPTTDCDTLP